MAVEKPVKTASGRYRARYKTADGHRRYAGIHDTSKRAKAFAWVAYAWDLAGEPQPLKTAGRPAKASQTPQELDTAPYPYPLPDHISEVSPGRYSAYWLFEGKTVRLGVHDSVETAFDMQRPFRLLELQKRPDWEFIKLARTDPKKFLAAFEADMLLEPVEFAIKIADGYHMTMQELASDTMVEEPSGVE